MKNIYFWMFTLLLSTFTFAQLTEDFESDITANGWTMYQTGDDDPGFTQTDSQANSGSYSYFHNDDNLTAESTSYLVSPAYTVQSGDNLSVYVRQNYSTGQYYNYSGIVISTTASNPISTPDAFSEIFELGQGFAEDTWTQVTEDLSSYVGQTIYIAFKYVGDWEHEFYVDDFAIGESCTNPAADFTLIEDCSNTQFSADVNVTDLGSASSVIISDGTNSQEVSTTGTYTFGPYTSGSDISITVSNTDNNTCFVSETLSFTCPPSNDDCATATTVSTFPYNLDGDASGATQDAVVTCNNTGLNDGVWFEIQAESAQYTINLTSLGWDAEIALFTGECGAQTCLDNADDAYSDGTETLTFIGDAGTSYYLVIGHYNGSTDQPEGEFQLEILAEEIPCASPSNLAVTATTDLSTMVNWVGDNDNTSYDLAWGETGFTPDTANAEDITDVSYEIGGLTPETSYDIYVRGNCNPGTSEWVGPMNFTTLEAGAILAGTDCLHPINVDALPYTTSDDTANYGDDYTGGNESCGLAPYYLNGDDVVYAYTPTEDTSIDISMTPGATYSGIFVYEDCNDIGNNCIAAAGNGGTDERVIDNLTVTGGQTYYIVISTWPSPDSTTYDLVITENTCINGTYTLTAVGACDTNEFYVEVNVTDMGSLTSYNVSDDQGNEAQTITEAGTLTFGPYASLTDVNFTLEANDTNCSETANITYRCASIGDNCENPLIVDSLPYTTSDDTANYFDDYSGAPGENCGATASYLSGDDVVYAYTPTEDTSIDISMTPGASYSGIFVYESCEDIGVNCVGGVASFSTEERLIEEFSVIGGQTYYIVISTWPSPQSTTYDLVITENTCISAEYEFTAVPDCDSGEFSVDVNVSSLGSSANLAVSDNQGSEAQSLTEAGTLSFGPYTSGTIVEFSFVADDANCNETETFSFSCPATNDDCIDAEALTLGSTFDDYPVLGNNIGATASETMPDPNCGGYQGGEVWYTVVVPASGHVIIETATAGEGSFTDSGLAVYSGSCETLTLIECDDDDGTGVYSMIELDGQTAGETLYVAVWEYGNNATGTFTVSAYDNLTCTPAQYTSDATVDCEAATYTITYNFTDLGSATTLTLTDDQGNEAQTLSAAGSLTFGPYDEGAPVSISVETGDVNCDFSESFAPYCPPTNDDCMDAEALTLGATFDDYPLIGNNTGATASETMPAPGCGGYQGGEVWYTVVVPESGHVIIETATAGEGSFTDSGLAVYSGNCDTLTLIECDDDGGTGTYSMIELDGQTAGETLYVAVWEYGNNATGTFSVSAYDDLTCIPAQYTSNATVDCEAATYTITYDFTDLGSATMLTLTDDQGNDAQTLSEAGSLTFGPYVEGAPVTISVETGDVNCDFSESFAEFCPAANDNCNDAESLTVGGSYGEYSTLGTNSGASDSGIAAPSCASYQGGDVWYSVTVPDNGSITIETGEAAEGVNFDTGIAVYSGTCDGQLVELDCDDDGADTGNFSLISLTDLTPGEVLLVRVWEYGNNATGNFVISAYSAGMGVNDFAGLNSVKLYPNPTTDILNVAGMDIVDVKVYSITGKAVTIKVSENIINTRNLSTGTYIIQLTDREGNVVTRKFIKK